MPSSPPVPPETSLDVARHWVEFTDPAEPAQRFRCDLTWLTSAYRCIFGDGCRGIEADRPDDGCCTLGAHFTERADLERVAAAVATLGPAEWERYDEGSGPHGWWESVPVETADESGEVGDEAGEAGAEQAGEAGAEQAGEAPAEELKTRVVDGACVLLNRPGFPGGAGCALHRAALARGEEPHRLKPEVCWQLPLRRAYRQVTGPDDVGYLEVTIGEYDRRAWGPGGHDLDWYCTGSPVAHTATQPLYLGSRAELVELMGPAAYAVLAEHCRAHLAAVEAARASASAADLLPLLVHPATLAAGRTPDIRQSPKRASTGRKPR